MESRWLVGRHAFDPAQVRAFRDTEEVDMRASKGSRFRDQSLKGQCGRLDNYASCKSGKNWMKPSDGRPDLAIRM